MALFHTRIVDRQSAKEVEWDITDFPSFYEAGRRGPVDSDFFLFAGDSWNLKFRAGLQPGYQSFFLYLCRRSSATGCSVRCTVGLKARDGQVERIEGVDLTFRSGEEFKGFLCDFSPRDNLLYRRLTELEPFGVLTIVVTLRMESPENGLTEAASTLCHPSSSQGIDNSVEASKQTPSHKCLEKLSDDLSELMVGGDGSDFTVKVRGEEFRLHRNILGARTPVFRSMLALDMRERSDGCVRIDDCEPDAFRAFVRYVYGGRADGLATDTVFGLCALADKYQVDDLKCECLDFMRRTLSADTLCDVVRVALAHGLPDLLDRAVDYFSRNAVAVMQTVEWMDFVKEKPIESNEIQLKARMRNQSE